MYALLGLLGLAAMAAIVLLAMTGAERAVARAVGLPQFRWFDVAPARAWKTSAVRAASCLAPFAVCAAIFWVVTVARGLPEAVTTVVEVLPDGAAADAGMQDGDRVLMIGEVPVSTWEELRAQVSKHAGPVPITIERAGKRQVLSVTPREGRIGTAAAPRMRDASMVEAAKLALVLPFRIVSDSAKAIVAIVTEKEVADLRGPVGIVKETSKATNDGVYSALYFLGILGAYFWPFIVATHAFDVVTGWLFRLTFTDRQLPAPAVQIARLRLAMYFSLGCWLALGAAQAVTAYTQVPGTVALSFLVTPGVCAIWPLLWVSARTLSPSRSPAGVVLPVVFLWCAAPIMAIWIAQQLGNEERRLRSHLNADQAPA